MSMCNIKLKNVSYVVSDSFLLQNISYTLRKNKTLSIIGPSGSGKTTLVKVLGGLLPFEGEILLDGEKMSQERLKEQVIPIFYEDSLPNVNLMTYFSATYPNFKETLFELNDYFQMEELLNVFFSELSFSNQILMEILFASLKQPKYLVIDDLLSYLDYRTKILLLNYLNSKHILLINVTSDLEDVLFTDSILCLYEGSIAIEGNTLAVLQNEKLLKRMGFSLPFYVDLSIQLKLYGLIKRVYLNKEDLVNALWK